MLLPISASERPERSFEAAQSTDDNGNQRTGYQIQIHHRIDAPISYNHACNSGKTEQIMKRTVTTL
jgi:hypothetical protein